VEQISTCSPWSTPRRIRQMPKGGHDPMESLRWSRLLAGPVTHGEREAHAGAGFLVGLVTL